MQKQLADQRPRLLSRGFCFYVIRIWYKTCEGLNIKQIIYVSMLFALPSYQPKQNTIMKKTNLILMFALLLAALQVQAQNQQLMPPHVQVSGVGEVKVQPTEVVVNVGVENRSRTLDGARLQTDRVASNIIRYLKRQGVDEKNIQTSFVNVRPIYDGDRFTKTSPDAYMAMKTMTIVIKKIDKYDDILSGLYEAGANHVDGISFQVPDIEKYKEEARKKAVNNAKQKATMLTTELGARVGRVYSIQEATMGGGPRPMHKAMMEVMVQDSAEGPSIAAGEIVISSTVDVTFLIE